MKHNDIDPPTDPTLPRLLTYSQLAEITGLSKGTLYSMVANGEVPHVRLGKRFVRFTEEAVQAWLASRAVDPKGGAR